MRCGTRGKIDERSAAGYSVCCESERASERTSGRVADAARPSGPPVRPYLLDIGVPGRRVTHDDDGGIDV